MDERIYTRSELGNFTGIENFVAGCDSEEDLVIGKNIRYGVVVIKCPLIGKNIKLVNGVCQQADCENHV